MISIARFLAFLTLCLFPCLSAFGQVEMCPPRPAPGSTVVDPILLPSQNGALSVDLTMVNTVGSDGIAQYCYLYGDGSTEAPTLQLSPGDTLTLNLTNHLTETAHSSSHMMPAQVAPGVASSSATTDSALASPASSNPCSGGSMTSTSTNIHFHGLNIPPKCHQDEVIRTSIPPNDPPFQYSIKIPANEPPGLYWYHPHPHGFTKTQVIGGASGALIVGGLEKLRPEAAGLPERVFVIRQQLQAGGGDDGSVLSINFVPFHLNLYARILTKPSEKELWRILNASSTQFLQLQLLNQGVPTSMTLVGLDGVPLSAARQLDTVIIPPAGRAEVIVRTPPKNGLYQFLNAGFDTGPAGDPNPARLLANVVPSNNAPDAPTHLPLATITETLKRFANLAQTVPNQQRRLYFSEADDGSAFFITVAGQTPRVYDPTEPPAIVTHEGTVEDWTIENRTTEVHAFHLHQLHFVVLEINGVPTNDPSIRDTIVVPYWDGASHQYPSVKVRVDFRDPEVVGTFLYHCHILDHEDGGMMAKIRVLPAQ